MSLVAMCLSVIADNKKATKLLKTNEVMVRCEDTFTLQGAIMKGIKQDSGREDFSIENIAHVKYNFNDSKEVDITTYLQITQQEMSCDGLQFGMCTSYVASIKSEVLQEVNTPKKPPMNEFSIMMKKAASKTFVEPTVTNILLKFLKNQTGMINNNDNAAMDRLHKLGNIQEQANEGASIFCILLCTRNRSLKHF